MKQVQFAFSEYTTLYAQLRRIKNVYSPSADVPVLFHIFTERVEPERIDQTLSILRRELPTALVAGCSTNGNIVHGDYSNELFAVSCTIFDEPTTGVELLQYPLSPESMEEVVSRLLGEVESRDGVKGVEMLTTVRGMSMTALCDGFSELDPSIPVFGGGAYSGDMESNEACVFSSVAGYMDRGIVLILYRGEELHLRTTYLTGWKPLGSYFEVTAAEGYVIRELNHRPAYEIYHKYLHIENDEHFFANTREFPFFYQYHDIDLLRVPIACHADGSLTMTSDIDEGVSIRLAYGDPWTIMESVWQEGQRMLDFAPEIALVFSCAGRRTFWGNDEIGKETEPYQLIAPTFGFYTSGEFLRTGRYVNQHNVTQVIVTMREGEAQEYVKPEFSFANQNRAGKISMINRLATFIKATTEELEAANKKLSEMAVVDTLTGVGNRNAYLEKIKQIDGEIAAGDADFAACIFDLNGLKRINDGQGHECGDIAIKETAQALSQVFGAENLYRAGGDEFMVILPGVTEDEMRTYFDAFDRTVSADNETNRVKIAVSKGCAVFRPGQDTQYTDVARRADQRMYDDKAAYYKTHGDRRRRSDTVS